MRVTSAVRAIIRSHEEAMKDMKSVKAINRRFPLASASMQPADAQPFSVSSTQGVAHVAKLLNEVAHNDRVPRQIIQRRHIIVREMLKSVGLDPKWPLHRCTYHFAKNALASREEIVIGSRCALKTILAAIKKKNLSSLSPLMLDDNILIDIAKKSNLSSLTKRQLNCLELTDDDYNGIDGIVDRWRRNAVSDDDPSALLSSLSLGICKKHRKPILTYTVDMMAYLRKNVLASRMGSLPTPKSFVPNPAPNAYGLPYRRVVIASVEFAHLGSDRLGKFSKEPFLRNFHVHSF